MPFNNLSIIIPFKTDGKDRERNWNWLKKRYQALMPEAELCIDELNVNPYCKSASINNAVRKSNREILLIVDADIIMSIEDLEKAINKVYDKGIVAPSRLVKFSENATNKILQNNDFNVADSLIDNNTQVFNSISSGICIIKKEIFKKCGGYDEIFKGWGNEDIAFSMCMHRVNGPIYRMPDFTMYHLYHQLDNNHINSDNFIRNNILLNTLYKSQNIDKTIEFNIKANKFL
ncbi:galactosyltransferase-related protein [Romboutsia sedimentorum]|uniref:galactosyltransferase-related protein n=1 Tax=Romboutsia sedimentorum TaxID=1368474 RepID=UPI0024DEA765|nr:galactosyltransferase-related protein [Romboutsia sedimentorum]MDK2587505.1 galactosyltransferase-related protein [Romboutsia sedimentorum]